MSLILMNITMCNHYKVGVCMWQLGNLTGEGNGILIWHIWDLGVVSRNITDQNIYSATSKFSWSQMVWFLRIILKALKEAAIWVAYVYTEVKRLPSIFLFMSKLMQCGWDSCFSYPLTTVLSTLILVLFDERVNAPLASVAFMDIQEIWLADFQVKVRYWSVHSPCSTRWWAVAFSWPHLWYGSS